MKYGLPNSAIEAIQKVFSKYPEIEKVILYGSRAMGNYRVGSDIDLTLCGKSLNLTLLHKVENEIDDLMLPYKIDISLQKHIQNSQLLEHIQQVGVIFFEKQAAKDLQSNYIFTNKTEI